VVNANRSWNGFALASAGNALTVFESIFLEIAYQGKLEQGGFSFQRPQERFHLQWILG
jgi:hypothetical protein